jgi:hypothetical protein
VTESTHDSEGVRTPSDDPDKRAAHALTTPVDRVLALHKAAGNRAVSRLLAGGSSDLPPERSLQRRSVQVRTSRSEPMTGNRVIVVRGGYEVDFSLLECTLTIKARVVPDRDVTADELARVKTETSAAFERFWDNKFILDDTRTRERFFLRVRVVYVDTGGHVRIRLRSGAGRDDQTTWFVDSIPTDRAHELSHQLGLLDEYIDARVPRRRNAAARGVFQDHSLLGDYYAEGIAQAEVKLRHGQQLASAIGSATRRPLQASLSGPFQGERLVRWRGMAAAAPAGSAERTRAQQEVRAIEADMMIPALTPTP